MSVHGCSGLYENAEVRARLVTLRLPNVISSVRTYSWNPPILPSGSLTEPKPERLVYDIYGTPASDGIRLGFVIRGLSKFPNSIGLRSCHKS